MKKTYIAPTSSTTLLFPEEMLASSDGDKTIPTGGTDKVTTEDQVLSIERGWNSANWANWGDKE